VITLVVTGDSLIRRSLYYLLVKVPWQANEQLP